MQRRGSAPDGGRGLRRDPRQQRSRIVVERIKAAARELMINGGPEAFTTNRIAEKAGLSVGSIYQYFPNKAAILGTLVEDLFDSVERDVLEALSASADVAGPQMRGRLVVREFVASLLGRADEIRALWPYLDTLPAARALRRPEDVVIETVLRMDGGRGANLRHPDARAVVEIAVECLSALLGAYLVQHRPRVPAGVFADLAADLVVRFLYDDEPLPGTL